MPIAGMGAWPCRLNATHASNVHPMHGHDAYLHLVHASANARRAALEGRHPMHVFSAFRLSNVGNRRPMHDPDTIPIAISGVVSVTCTRCTRGSEGAIR
jgi:hypothetical protein